MKVFSGDEAKRQVKIHSVGPQTGGVNGEWPAEGNSKLYLLECTITFITESLPWHEREVETHSFANSSEKPRKN